MRMLKILILIAIFGRHNSRHGNFKENTGRNLCCTRACITGQKGIDREYTSILDTEDVQSFRRIPRQDYGKRKA